jgi:hypothetical protein
MSEIQWESSMDKAKELSQATDKPILLDFFSPQ